MSKSSEGYQPSEEVSQAEGMMTPSQKELSGGKEDIDKMRADYENMKIELGVVGDLTINSIGTIKGTLGGHEVYLTVSGTGRIDGYDFCFPSINREEQSQYFRMYTRYRPLAKLGSRVASDKAIETGLIEDAKNEVEQESAKYLKSQARKEVNHPQGSQVHAARALAQEILGYGNTN